MLRNTCITLAIMLAVLAYGSCGQDPEEAAATVTACAYERAEFQRQLDNVYKGVQRAWATAEAGPQVVARHLHPSQVEQFLANDPEWQAALRISEMYQNMEPDAKLVECYHRGIIE